MSDSQDGGPDGRRDPEGGQDTGHHEYTEGGDPVCWLDRVCDECGAMREDMRAARCARCGTPFHGAGADSGGARQGGAQA
ncbi:hypothetical protein [Actinacidiphila bryophytorum]|uniref:Uncharacterized protein n=1 Tax=Actinacidiphila bryophytorum TaxID=1436133 RepID=A0A9W4H7J7_9ACTN|nr:hypothetical protein [Actinacidiphila bryophytorum]MBM9437504.1 hypothetical protein [Actinacidiphila bryophytorum]MBN6547084.1 hypothetical protein [Actinacidiphila bryophytorum]CAG7656138.1 conserved hypothetical protein [Actinacidiphila bryophytorum]